MDQRAALFEPLVRENSTFITIIAGRDEAGTVVRKEIFHPDTYFDQYSLELEDLKVGNICHDLHIHPHPGRRAYALSGGRRRHSMAADNCLALVTIAHLHR